MGSFWKVVGLAVLISLPCLALGNNIFPNLNALKSLMEPNANTSQLHLGLPENFGAKFLSKAMVPFYIREFLAPLNDDWGQELFINFTTKLLVGVESDDCKGHIIEWILRYLSLDLKWAWEKDKWAAQMIDAWGKIPEGILTGHINSYGDWDECVQAAASEIDILNTQYPEISTNFEGQYCTSYILDYKSALGAAGRLSEDESAVAKASTLKNLGWNEDEIGVKEAVSIEELIRTILTQKPSMTMLFPSFSTCVPNTCSTKDVQNILVNALNMTYGAFNEETKASLPWPLIINCSDGNKKDLDAAAIIVIIILSSLLVLCVSTGVVDYWMNHGVEKAPERGKAYKYLMAFSFYTNTKKWLSTRKSADDLGCLHGIRFLSTAWVILGHTYFVFISGPQWNLLDVQKVWKNWTTLAVLNGTFSVDTFFVMSGMLATYNILKLLDKTKGKFNVPMFYFHRIVRITPTYAILVAIASTLTIYWGSGPLWFTIEDSEKLCRKNWWVNLLYINNIYKSEESCNGESWYLANDMQFYILSPLIVYPIWRWRRIGLGLLIIYTILSCISPMLVMHYQNTPPGAIFSRTGDEMMNMTKIYFRPWARIQTFLVGMWLGWILHFTKGRQMRISPLVVASGWVASTALALTVMFAIYPWYNPENPIPKASGLMYAGLSRFSFGVSIAWIIFACVKGYGGIVNSFLSWKVFMPLGRLCFCVYLISLHLQHTLHVGLKIPIKFNEYTLVNLFFSHMVSSYLAGFVATMLFESPFIILQKLIFEGK